MSLLHLILDLAALLLWLGWRSFGLLRNGPAALSLVSTLQRAAPRRSSRWAYAASLLSLLVLRSFFYSHIGSGVNWTPAIDLVAITLPFRSDQVTLMLIFSLLSFALSLGTIYSWLLLISAVNHRVPDSEPWQKLVRLHLGWLERLPGALRLFLPLIGLALLWGLAGPGLEKLGLIPAHNSGTRLWAQAGVLGIAALMVWKYFLIGLLGLHLLNTYVYLGNVPIFAFASLTAQNLFLPVHWLPLRLGKVDFAPILGIALVLFLSEVGRECLPKLYQRLPL